MTLPEVTDDMLAFNVRIQNWADANVEPKGISHTTVKTYTIDPAADPAIEGGRKVRIAAYEPNRKRMVVQVIDVAILIDTAQPTTSPELSTVASPGTGRLLPPSLYEYIFYGPDEWWINSTTAATRVTVTKEYC